MSTPSLRWSPWFKLIVSNHLLQWWRDLDNAMRTDAHAQRDTIHRYV
jgi:hypothetical protein